MKDVREWRERYLRVMDEIMGRCVSGECMETRKTGEKWREEVENERRRGMESGRRAWGGG